MNEIYDAISMYGAPKLLESVNPQEHLRSFTEEERVASVKALGRLRHGLTIGLTGWPARKEYSPVAGAVFVIRAYPRAPEMLPTDFTWTKIECSVKDVELWGGILKDVTRRL